VYALGVIAYELLAGARPFKGPKAEDFYEQHLHDTPPSLPGFPSTLDALVQECLYKAPEARPSPANLAARLARIAQSQPSSGGLAKLQEAHRAEVSRRGEAARRESASRSEAERRDDLFRAATTGLDRIIDGLREAITEHAPTAQVEQWRGGWTILLNWAGLGFGAATKSTAEVPSFDVIGHASLSVSMPPERSPSDNYGGRSHSLWFCDAKEAGHYQWFETAFMFSPLLRGANPDVQDRAPFALDPGPQSAQALSAGINTFQVAWPFTVISIGEMDEFIDRWASWLADASEDRLRLPSELPERPTQGSWRQS
jgi:serine/threonine-protein kinase